MSNPARFAAMFLVVGACAVLAAPIAGGSAADGRASGLTVHEWGTFTSVAGPDGQAVPWYPLSEASDLPCFVRMLTQDSPKVLVRGLPAVSATVRMETPVIYFYSPKELTARVSVRFPQGLITEWYPAATITPAFFPKDAGDATGTIDWPAVLVRPGASPVLPREPGWSHYYPARDTDAAPVTVGDQHEKFLFYRGMASFPVTLRATVDGTGRIAVTNAGWHPLQRAILFQNVGGRLGFREIDPLGTGATLAIEPPVLGADFAALASRLTSLLVEEGLYLREAQAMVETWRDSWFEAGTRLIYLVPRADVDRILPLTISPAPDTVARAFVGRVEIITPEREREVEQALLTRDLRTLASCGRFLQPIVAGLAFRASLAGRWGEINDLLRLVAAASTPEHTCEVPATGR